MKKRLIAVGFLFVCANLALPAISRAQTMDSNGSAKLDYGGLVKCDGVLDSKSVEPDRQNVCNFAAAIGMVNSLIKWAFMLTIPIFIGLCAYAGFLYMTPNPSNRGKANKMLWAALKGFVIMLCAWFIVSTLLDWVLKSEFRTAADALLQQTK